MMLEVAYIFRLHGSELIERDVQRPDAALSRRAMKDIETCRTETLATTLIYVPRATSGYSYIPARPTGPKCKNDQGQPLASSAKELLLHTHHFPPAHATQLTCTPSMAPPWPQPSADDLQSALPALPPQHRQSTGSKTTRFVGGRLGIGGRDPNLDPPNSSILPTCITSSPAVVGLC